MSLSQIPIIYMFPTQNNKPADENGTTESHEKEEKDLLEGVKHVEVESVQAGFRHCRDSHEQAIDISGPWIWASRAEVEEDGCKESCQDKVGVMKT
jgi:hypothetical protein